MPAKDRYHDIVKHALEKDGWLIIQEQYVLKTGRRRLLVDLQAENQTRLITILVEVKGLDSSASEVTELADAIGKYVLYETILAEEGINLPLYLAIPLSAYNGIMSESIGITIRQKLKMRLIVVDLEQEEIVRWID